MDTLNPLPRSLDPLPEEALPGYLLRLAHRLGLTPARSQAAAKPGNASAGAAPSSTTPEA